jgi:hypothetical protein
MPSHAIKDIQDAALDGNVPLADVLRRVMALGGRVGSPELREWASRELHGYVGIDVELPAYRKVPAPIMIDVLSPGRHVTGRQMSPRAFPEGIRDVIKEEAKLAQGIGEIEAMVEPADASGLKISLTPEDEALPSAEVANQAVSVAIGRVGGIGSRVTVAPNQRAGSVSHPVTPGESGTRRWVILATLATVVAALVAVATWQGWWT